MLDLNSGRSIRIETCSEKKNCNLEAILSTLAIFIEGFVLCDFPRSLLLNRRYYVKMFPLSFKKQCFVHTVTQNILNTNSNNKKKKKKAANI